MLLTEVAVSRECAGRWVTVELPLDRFPLVGAGPVRLCSYDRIGSVEFRVAQNEIFAGGGRGIIGIDDVQLVER